MPTGMKNINGQTLSRLDNLSPYSDLLDGCVLLPLEDETWTSPALDGGDNDMTDGPVRIALQHYKYRAKEKIVLINKKTITDVHKAFKQKFPKHSANNNKSDARTEYVVQPAGTKATEADWFLLDEESVQRLRQGDTITCKQKTLDKT